MLTRDILYSVFNAISVPALIIEKRNSQYFIIAVNREFVKMTGIGISDLMNRELKECFYRPSDPSTLKVVEELYETLDNVFETKKDSNLANVRYDIRNEFSLNLMPRYWERKNTAILNANNDVEYVLHTVRDITEEVLKEQENFKKEGPDKYKELLEQAESISKFGTWELDLRTQELKWSDGVFRMCGYIPNEFEVTFESGLSVIHPEDQEFAIQMMNNAIQKGVEYNIEKRFVQKDGNIIDVQSRGKVLKNIVGENVKLIGVFQDITEQKKNIQKIQSLIKDATESKHKFQEMIESINDGFVSFSADWDIEFLNDKAAKLLGAESTSDLQNKNLVDLYPEILENSFFKSFKTVMYDRIPMVTRDLYLPTNTMLENRIYPLSNGGVGVLFYESK